MYGKEQDATKVTKLYYQDYYHECHHDWYLAILSFAIKMTSDDCALSS